MLNPLTLSEAAPLPARGGRRAAGGNAILCIYQGGAIKTKPDQISRDPYQATQAALNLCVCQLAMSLRTGRAKQVHPQGEPAVALAVARPTLKTNFKHCALLKNKKNNSSWWFLRWSGPHRPRTQDYTRWWCRITLNNFKVAMKTECVIVMDFVLIGWD